MRVFVCDVVGDCVGVLVLLSWCLCRCSFLSFRSSLLGVCVLVGVCYAFLFV